MEPSIFKYIFRYSSKQQLYLVLVIIFYYPFLYISLELPKLIVNKAIENNVGGPPFDFNIFGFDVQSGLEQVTFLVVLSVMYLGAVFVNGGFKYYINVYKGRMGERLLRLLRYQLYNRILRFSLPQFRKVSQGDLIPIITAEVEPLGGFIGTAFADPLFFGGQLVIIITFIVSQDPVLGVAAISLYPVQIYLIPRLQRKVNKLAKARVLNVRRLSDHISESVSGIIEVHSHNASQYELAKFAGRLARIYDIRYELFRRKFFIKFLNNFIDKLTPFFFFSIGGYLVIQGELTFGALVAVLAAYKELAAPWKELLSWYQQKEDIRIKYQQIVEQFDPPNITKPELILEVPPKIPHLQGDVVANVSLLDENGVFILKDTSLSIPVNQHVAVLGNVESGKSELAMLLARLITPSHGKITIGGQDTALMPEAITGRRIAYAGPNGHLNSCSIHENLVYGLNHIANGSPALDPHKTSNFSGYVKTHSSGGRDCLFEPDWIDYSAAGVSGREELQARILEVLKEVQLDREIYKIGLHEKINPIHQPDIADRMIIARKVLQERLRSNANLAKSVELFDKDLYNFNATVGENLLFGTPLNNQFKAERIAKQECIRAVLDDNGLTDVFLEIGKKVAETMIELFSDLPPEHEFFQTYSFISSEQLPNFEQVLARIARGNIIEERDRVKLLSLPFQLAPARHRLGVITAEIQAQILSARQALLNDMPAELARGVSFFEEERFNPEVSLQENILFGKLAHGFAAGEEQIGSAISEIIDELDLRGTVISVGLGSQVGVGGALLSGAQRQKLSIGRCIIKNPDLLILDGASDTLDKKSQEEMIETILLSRAGRGIIWVMNRPQRIDLFDHVILMKNGSIVGQGSPDSMAKHVKAEGS